MGILKSASSGGFEKMCCGGDGGRKEVAVVMDKKVAKRGSFILPQGRWDERLCSRDRKGEVVLSTYEEDD